MPEDVEVWGEPEGGMPAHGRWCDGAPRVDATTIYHRAPCEVAARAGSDDLAEWFCECCGSSTWTDAQTGQA